MDAETVALAVLMRKEKTNPTMLLTAKGGFTHKVQKWNSVPKHIKLHAMLKQKNEDNEGTKI